MERWVVEMSTGCYAYFEPLLPLLLPLLLLLGGAYHTRLRCSGQNCLYLTSFVPEHAGHIIGNKHVPICSAASKWRPHADSMHARILFLKIGEPSESVRCVFGHESAGARPRLRCVGKCLSRRAAAAQHRGVSKHSKHGRQHRRWMQAQHYPEPVRAARRGQ